MSEFASVRNEIGLVRDMSSNAVLSTDLNEKREFMRLREHTINTEHINSKLDDIFSEIRNIKSILKELSVIKCEHPRTK